MIMNIFEIAGIVLTAIYVLCLVGIIEEKEFFGSVALYIIAMGVLEIVIILKG